MLDQSQRYFIFSWFFFVFSFISEIVGLEEYMSDLRVDFCV